MSLLTSDKFFSCDLFNSRLMQNSEFLFSGFVNNRGRMVTCGKNNSLNFHDEKSLEMFVMEIALDFSMKNEFNDVLGNVEYAVTKRKNTNVICIPIDEFILVIIADNHISVEGVVTKVYHTLSKFIKIEVNLISDKIMEVTVQ